MLCFVVLAAPAWPQVNAPAFACTASASPPATVRAEGVTELVGDVLLVCTGGTPTPNGSQMPMVNVQLTLNVNLTSRVLGTNGSRATEALLLIDDPGARTNPGTPQTFCTTPETGCTVTAPLALDARTPNMFLGVVSLRPALDFFIRVPVDPRRDSGVRLLRVTNIRANANQAYIDAVALDPSLSAIAITGTVSMTDVNGNAIPVTNPTVTLASAAPSLAFSVSGTRLDTSREVPRSMRLAGAARQPSR